MLITHETLDRFKTSNKLFDGINVSLEAQKVLKEQKYKVERGETLLTIAQKHNIKLDDLRKLNQFTTDNIKAGQEILVPAKALLAQSNAPQANKQIHTVAPGDSFYSISKKYGCSIDDLMKWNNKTNARLNAGEKLVVYPNV